MEMGFVTNQDSFSISLPTGPSIGDKLRVYQYMTSSYVEISALISRKLQRKIYVRLDADGDAFIASIVEAPIYGYGNTPALALESIRRQIEVCYEELNEDDNYGVEWLAFRTYLRRIII